MIHRLFTTSSCVGASRAIVCVSKLLKVSSAQRRPSHLPNFRCQWRRGTAACGCKTGALIPTLPPSSSSAFGVNSLPVHRSPGGNRLIVRAFTTPLAVPTSTVFDPSIGSKYLPCSHRESRGPRRRLDGCTGIHHTRSPNCAKGRTARLTTFRSSAVLPSRPPQTDCACCLHTAQATSTDHGPLAPLHPKLTSLTDLT